MCGSGARKRSMRTGFPFGWVPSPMTGASASSHTTGQVTHHIGPDLDAEREHLFHDLEKTGDLSETYFEDHFQKTKSGRNGGGDSWFTDGRLEVGIIRAH